ncbi:MAG TPA: large conductance mechanosensitive channel protein MscL [Lachnoclostridium phytofermentans]|uniref:Large-conductance mechanosensitive channel n=1 Tax=Lachnoclostridium phytofermentans TaxID=66219 RepID=A0A3D2XAC8_9FIRM|nr:large conductance mechanosensitive channel protein MscL [Lachnoclostridium sp.]HCL04089.1 large conductance mechanosensitive channel protein MscL [Lachnoclostridium phytofermentans]
MKKFLKEFKEFALKGNVMNLAVGVIIGSAFQGIVTSLTDNILSPIIGLFTRQNFDSLQLDIFGITLRYGAFITALINFIIMAFVVFLLVKGMNRILFFEDRKKKVDVKPTEKDCPYCMTKININATRCPHCTSQLETITVNESDKS